MLTSSIVMSLKCRLGVTAGLWFRHYMSTITTMSHGQSLTHRPLTRTVSQYLTFLQLWLNAGPKVNQTEMKYKCFAIFCESGLVLVVLSSLKLVNASNIAFDWQWAIFIRQLVCEALNLLFLLGRSSAVGEATTTTHLSSMKNIPNEC